MWILGKNWPSSSHKNKKKFTNREKDRRMDIAGELMKTSNHFMYNTYFQDVPACILCRALPHPALEMMCLFRQTLNTGSK